MKIQSTPKGFRLHIGLFGQRNVGKSSILNALTRQQVSIVSDTPGTTTDPVEKPMELLPVGPVLFIDTAGVDDPGELGELRVRRTKMVFDRTDLGLLVTGDDPWGEFEETILEELRRRGIPVIVVFNKADLSAPDAGRKALLEKAGIAMVTVSASSGEGIEDLRRALIQSAPEEFINAPPIVADLIPPGELVMLVVPIDLEAPKGRLILPQVQAMRDILDADAYCMVVKEGELEAALDRLKRPPALVVTDSQAFAEVGALVPEEVSLTSFSILFARHKGDLAELVRGSRAIEELRPGDSVLICEACAHHPVEGDIGREKIPAWLGSYVGGELKFTHVQGHDFPEDLSPFRLVIQCGSCMWNRREMLSRILHCRQAGVPISNYGLTIAFSLGIFPRALAPFPAPEAL